MKSFLCVAGLLLAAFALSAFAQGQGRLSPDDQREFDKFYTKWVNDTRKNDTDDIAKDVSRMQQIMSRNHIPVDVAYDQVASTGGAYEARDYRGQLSVDEQRDFDKHYTKWVNDTRKNDRDDIAKDARHMQEIMARNNIPSNVPFNRIASSGYARERSPAEAYPVRNQWRERLSLDDQRDFDSAYAGWVEDTRTNDHDNLRKDAGDMQAIMARNNIPPDVPFDQIAKTDAYPDTSYQDGSRGWQGRLAADDQREFDRHYQNWLFDTRENNRDKVDEDVRYMQDIMARNNIAANVPFDRIASPDAAVRH
jgi:hypothetical protein